VADHVRRVDELLERIAHDLARAQMLGADCDDCGLPADDHKPECLVRLIEQAAGTGDVKSRHELLRRARQPFERSERDGSLCFVCQRPGGHAQECVMFRIDGLLAEGASLQS
jgi:hypothetical protein